MSAKPEKLMKILIMNEKISISSEKLEELFRKDEIFRKDVT